jgi:hypothetical protein
MTMRGFRWAATVLVTCAALVVSGAPRASAGVTSALSPESAPGRAGIARTGSPPPLPKAPSSPGTLAPMSAGGGPSGTAEAAVAAASRQAHASGKPVTVAALTTATDTTTVNPGGRVTVKEDVLPARVRGGSGWVPVSTRLRRDANGSLSPVAVPGDTVVISGGGSAPLARLSADGTSLALSWPGRLPAPVVSGSSATYRDVLPGVDLVLTATSVQSGGFSEVLVVHNAAAARDPGLARVTLGVSARGARLHAAPGGGLVATGTDLAGYYSAAAPLMWDSSSLAPTASKEAVSAAARAARAMGAGLAPPGLAGPASSQAGPADGARLARVNASVIAGGTTLSLVPDAGMLSSPATAFPVFIDPSFSWSTQDGSRQHFDEVQSACPTASHYDTSDTTDYWSLGVGYDGFGDDCNGANGYAYSYYQVAVPSQIWGGYLNSATLDAQEAYTASCSASADVTLSWTGAMNSGTDWNNKPGVDSNVVTDNVGPGPSNSCDTSYDTNSSDWKGVGFNVLSVMDKAASGHWSNFTFRLWENGNSNDVDWKRFGRSPYLQITYNQAPSTPSGLQISTGGAGSDCTSSPYPWVGKLSSGGTTMSAVVSQKDGDELEGIFEYKLDSASSWTTVDSTSTAIKSGTKALAVIPASFTNSLADGTEVDWRVEADDGAPSGYGPDSAWSSECHFLADPTAPPAPTVTAGFSSDPTAGSSVSFTIASNDTTSDPATEFVWGLDKVPSSSGPVAAQVVSLSSGQTSATVTVPVPGPGPHDLYAYARDAAGNASQWSGSSDPASFSAAADPPASYASFAAALGAGQSFDNDMISTNASNAGTANGDGNDDAFSEAELKAAGWEPGGTVTVDGARFTLPSFGSGAPDNILAANQTIDLPAGSQGNSLVVLATSSNGDAASPDAADLDAASDDTVPYVPAGSAVTGYECDTAGTGQGDCQLPTGYVTYGDSSQSQYALTVPNWVSGPSGPAAMRLPDRLGPKGVQTGQLSKIYAFALPVNPAQPVTSVTLPDIGSVLSAGGISYPALHIFGVAVANTTTATPGGATLAPGQTWTGAWASPTEGAYAPLPGYGSAFSSQTFRIALQAAAGGSAVRLRLSDDLGWLAGSSGEPLDIGHVTVAAQDTGASVSGTPVTAEFGGSQSVTIPEGGDAYSDPVPMTVAPGAYLTVSIYLSNSVPYLVQHSMCSACAEYITAAGAGDQTMNTSGSVFSGSGTLEGQFTDILTGLDVQTSGTPTAVVLGDGLIDALGSATTAPLQGTRVSDDLAAALQAAAGPGNQPAFGVVGEGIEANDVLTDTDVTTGNGGPSAMTRLAQDVLAEPGVGTVVVDEGLEDLLQAGNSATIEDNLIDDGYNELATQLNAWGVSVVFGTLTPCSGYAGSGSSPEDSCTTGSGTTVDGNRSDIDSSYLDGQFGNQACAIGPCIVSDDFDSAVSNLAAPEALLAADDSGDHVNLSDAGYSAITATIPPSQLLPDSPNGS